MTSGNDHESGRMSGRTPTWLGQAPVLVGPERHRRWSVEEKLRVERPRLRRTLSIYVHWPKVPDQVPIGANLHLLSSPQRRLGSTFLFVIARKRVDTSFLLV